MSAPWSEQEIFAAVDAYVEMLQKQIAGKPFTKAEYYVKLAAQLGRTKGSCEYRMQNISYVYASLNKQWLIGLKPAKHAGTRVASIIRKCILKLDNTVISEENIFPPPLIEPSNNPALKKPKGVINPQTSAITVIKMSRDSQVKNWILKTANGNCECCKKSAPFVLDNGQQFLEVHHLKPLAGGGSDTVSNAIALCPNCHRELHYGKDREKKLNKLYSSLPRVQPE